MPEPVIAYPSELPVSAARGEIAEAIAGHQVVIIAGATGSGKTTQLPKICLELGRSRIAHTQPRRIAARTIAERIAEELQVPLGTTVGYKVRFTDTVSEETAIALMTDGILLNEIHRDRLLRRYDTIIVDEAHERSLNVDFLLGYLRRILPERPDLKVIITSATIDPESFAAHFSAADEQPAPIVEVSGRTYPVEIRYRPRVPDEEAPDAVGEPLDEVGAILEALGELDREPPGDVLVFLPGEAEIRDAADAVRAAYARDAAPTEVLPLFGRLSAADQHRVFERSSVAGVRRRVVLATNVAETSLTVPGIRYVVDAGTARISRYSARSKIQRLPIEPVSQASAQQRSGRAGRTSDGIAIRLYAEADFNARPEFTDPEILRTSLASVILQMLSLGFGDIQAFPFLTPPDSRGVKAALELLTELGAVVVEPGREPRLTRIGREISRMPIDPRFARMLVEATRTNVAEHVLAIVAGLSLQDVRERPEDRREAADQAHARFTDPTSDFLTLLNLWRYLRRAQRENGSSAFRRLCRSEFLNYVRVREWFDVHRQLSSLVRTRPRTNADDESTDADAIHRAILAGLLSHLGLLDPRTVGKDKRTVEYRGARGIRFVIGSGSALRRGRPEAVMAAELVETTRLYARTVARVDPEWAEALAADLVTRRLSEPRWSKRAGAAVASEKVTLFGLEIVPARRVQLARVDRPAARELFLRHALVEGDWDPAGLDKRLSAFLRQNAELRRRLEKLEERERRRDVLVGDEAVYDFYAARIPVDVFDTRSFEAWWRTASAAQPRLLTMREEDLLADGERSDAAEYPTRWTQGDQTLTLTYRFEPGSPEDGVHVVIPLPLLAGVRADGFDWQVPGLRDELITGLLRALPKAIRRHVVPAADWATRFAGELAPGAPENHAGLPPEPLREALARLIQRHANQPVHADDFDLARVPAHLLPTFRVVDGRGRTAASGKDLAELQGRLADRARESVAARLASPAPTPVRGPAAEPGSGRPTPSPRGFVERDGLTSWPTGELPEVVDTRVAGGVVRGYPGIVDEGDSVAVRIHATAADADAATVSGVRRLVLLAVPSPASYVLEHLHASEKLALAASPYPAARALIEDARAAVADEVIRRSAPSGVLRSEAEFTRVRDAVSAAMLDRLFAVVSLTADILVRSREVERALKDQTSLALLGALGDIRGQLGGLIFPGFISRSGTARLAHYPRYLEAILIRLNDLADQPGRDRQRLTEFERVRDLYRESGGEVPSAETAPAALQQVRWLLEEFRVSLFAQRLGTAEPVSAQRIGKALRSVRTE